MACERLMDERIRTDSVKGNIRGDPYLAKEYLAALSKGTLERVRIRRWEAGKSRFRAVTDKGNEIIIDAPRGTKIRHGDVLHLEENRIIVVEWLEEDALVATFSTNTDRIGIQDAVKLGYCLGNLHCPIELTESKVVVPVESRKESLKRALTKIGGINITMETRVVEPSLDGYRIDHE